MTTRDPSDEKKAALAAYNSVVEAAELDDITLIFTNFVIKPDYYKVALAQETAHKVKRELDSDFSAFSYDAERKFLGGKFDWTIDAAFARKKLLSVRASFIVSYENVPDVEQRHMEAFIRRVGRFATYPYFRTLVSQFSWESKAELPPLPVLK